jgi:hypothetical protein
MISVAYFATGTITVVVTISGTIMQLLGICRNCICMAELWYGLPTTRDQSGAMVLLSTDTLENREAA